MFHPMICKRTSAENWILPGIVILGSVLTGYLLAKDPCSHRAKSVIGNGADEKNNTFEVKV